MVKYFQSEDIANTGLHVQGVLHWQRAEILQRLKKIDITSNNVILSVNGQYYRSIRRKTVGSSKKAKRRLGLTPNIKVGHLVRNMVENDHTNARHEQAMLGTLELHHYSSNITEGRLELNDGNSLDSRPHATDKIIFQTLRRSEIRYHRTARGFKEDSAQHNWTNKDYK